MAKPTSKDLRERIVKAVAEGGTVRAVGERFAVAPSTVVKVAQLFRETGSVVPRKIGGDNRSHAIEAHKDRLLALVAARPDITIAEVIENLRQIGMNASTGVVWRFYQRHGFSFKKKLRTPPSKNAPT